VIGQFCSAVYYYTPLPGKKKIPESHIINPLLTKLARSRWLDIGLVLFFASLTTCKHVKKELCQYPAILTSHLVNNPHLLQIKA